jgi:monoamine oxidase
MTEKCDVIIIGAGIAGLAAARDLVRAGRNVVVLEARDRIGGRILTRHDGDTVELGAEFVHGKPPAIFEIAKAAGLRAVEGTDRRLLAENGTLRPLDDFWDIIEEVDSQIDEDAQITYAEFLRNAKASPFKKTIAKSYVEGFNASRADLISAAAVALEDSASENLEGDKQFRLVDGYDALVRKFARELPNDCIRLNHTVREVHWREGRVDVDAEFRAEQCIVTLPLGILRGSSVHFDPPLTTKRDAIAHLEVGHVVKLMLQFRERFWETHSPFGFALNLEADFPTWWTQEPTTANSLTGWAGGPAAEKLSGRTPDELREIALRSIAQTFNLSPGKLRDLFVRDYFHDWTNDPFARGAYSYPKVGGIEAARALAQPTGDTLFFAGEATDSRGFNGTVHGAIESGLRAAREAIARG